MNLRQGISDVARGFGALVIIGAAGLLAACSHESPVAQFDAPYKKHSVSKPAVRLAAAQTKAKYSTANQPIVVRLKTRTEQVAYGNGPYICSPSGFGRMSHCVPRS